MTEDDATPSVQQKDADRMEIDSQPASTSTSANRPKAKAGASRPAKAFAPIASSGASAGAASAAAAVGAAGASLEPETGDGDASATSTAAGAAGGAAAPAKPKRGGSKPILKVSGIARVDNNQKPTLFTSTVQINQKNYYTDYLRRDDQIMYYREWNEDQKRQKEAKEEAAKAKRDVQPVDTPREEAEALPAGAKTIVIHMGSQNLRVGLASQAYPKASPNVIAHRRPFKRPNEQPSSSKGARVPEISPEYEQLVQAEADYENGTSATKPPAEPDAYLMFGADYKQAHSTVYRDFRERMRFYKRRVVPNSHELVVGFNQRARSKPELIPDHNDPGRIEWVDPQEEHWPQSITGHRALTIVPELIATKQTNDTLMTNTNNSNDPPYIYELKWPIRHGLFNETDYNSTQELLGDISLILVDAFERELGITFKNYHEYNAVFIIPDLYVRSYVDNMVALLLQMGLNGVAIIQESMAATFGAGVSTACVIDIGAHTSSIACVEEGMVIPDSRVNLKFGGEDVTIALSKLLLMSFFPFKELDLARAYDFAVAEDLKHRYATTNDADITVQLYNFIKRSPRKSAQKFQFKVFEEVMLAPLGFFYPEIFDQQRKIADWCTKEKPVYHELGKFRYKMVPARLSLFPRSLDIYDSTPNDPESAAQNAIARARLTVYNMPVGPNANVSMEPPASAKQPVPFAIDSANDTSSTPVTENTDAPPAILDLPDDPLRYALTGLDHAIIESITQAALSKMQAAGQLSGVTLGPAAAAATPAPGAQSSAAPATNGTAAAPATPSAAGTTPQANSALPDPTVAMTNLGNAEQVFYENLLIVGGAAAKLPGFNTLLTDRIGMWLSHANKTVPGEIAVMPAPREMDPQVLTWKGGGVFAKLKIVSECWISAHDWEMLGNRALQYKTLFAY